MFFVFLKKILQCIKRIIWYDCGNQSAWIYFYVDDYLRGKEIRCKKQAATFGMLQETKRWSFHQLKTFLLLMQLHVMIMNSTIAFF